MPNGDVPAAGLDVTVIDARVADGHTVGFLGFTDDDWTTGTQTYIFGNLWPSVYGQGHGPTGIYTHEVGHYLGMSHPHDGYDSAVGEINAGAPEFGYVYLGDEVASVMSYLRTSFSFSQFDRDDEGRWSTLSYLNEADRVLAAIEASSRAGEGAGAVRAADAEASAALAQLAARQFTAAATAMAHAYDGVVGAARAIGLPLAPASYQGDTQPRGGHRFHLPGPIEPDDD